MFSSTYDVFVLGPHDGVNPIHDSVSGAALLDLIVPLWGGNTLGVQYSIQYNYTVHADQYIVQAIQCTYDLVRRVNHMVHSTNNKFNALNLTNYAVFNAI